MAWKTDEGSPVQPGQCFCTQVCGCNGCCACMTVALTWLITLHILLIWQHLTMFCSPTWKKKHLAGKQYHTNDEVISAVEDFFLRIRMRASIPWESKQLQHQMEEVCGLQGRLFWKINHINLFGQIWPLHQSQSMNFSANPCILPTVNIEKVFFVIWCSSW